jgi:nitroreductase
MSEFDDIIKRRKMVRQYVQDKPIPQEIVNKLIVSAHRAPSAGHTQVQEFIIVQDTLLKEKLGESALNQAQLYGAPLLIVVCPNISRSVDRYRKRGR